MEQKWIKKWADAKIFEPEIDNNRPKFFATFPYPYINAYLHVGHLYSLMRTEAFVRYKRMKGFNVLFPQAWHATGSPIISATERVIAKEPKQIKIMKDMGITGDLLAKFEKPEFWIEFFEPECEKDYKSMGMSVDWRRSFHTTSLNPHYDKFIRWQFRKLKEKNYVIKGKFPVVWCPKCETAIGDHARKEGEGETTQDFIWGKFRLKDSDLILMAGTTRPDAFYGQTHIWIDPDATYKIVKVKDEKWVVGPEAVKKIEDQYDKTGVIGEIHAKELMGKWTRGPLVDYDTYIVPAWFIDANVGSGIVYSALEDPVDLYELERIHNDMDLIRQYNLDEEVIAKLKPISIIDIPGMGENLGKEIGDEFGVKSPDDKKRIEEAKGELNKRVFRKGVMKNNCGACAGMTVQDALVYLKKHLIEANEAVMFYELSGKVVCRCLTEAVVNVVSDQWFVDYANPEWKKLAHECLDQMKLYPEKSRQQFNHVIDWLHEWACTRETGLGTKLPWDEKWLIESLSDSTIYMAYYTIVHKLQKLNPDDVTDELFDYVLLGKGDCKDPVWDEMKAEFDYWYPMDFRNSGKDLIQNHLTFSIFIHTAIFKKENWPGSFGVNGWVTVDGNKMSKSLGNFIPMRNMVKEFGPDASRFTVLSGGEGLDDANWDTELAKSMKPKIRKLLEFCVENYNKGTDQVRAIDTWMESTLNRIIKQATDVMEKTNFRSALQISYFELQRAIKWYQRRCGEPNKDMMNKVIEAQILLLAPFIPFFAEEAWERIGKQGLVSVAPWPEFDETKIDSNAELAEEMIRSTREDIFAVLKLANVSKPKKIQLFVAEKWKYKLFSELKVLLEQTRDMKEIMGKVMQDDEFKKHGKQVTTMIQHALKKGIDNVLSQDIEFKAIRESVEFFKDDFKCPIDLINADKSKESKARKAMPGKPAILVE